MVRVNYPKEFIQAVKKACPDMLELHKALDEGMDVEYWMTQKLQRGYMTGAISVEKILAAKSLEELQESAQNVLIRDQLYHQYNANVANWRCKP